MKLSKKHFLGVGIGFVLFMELLGCTPNGPSPDAVSQTQSSKAFIAADQQWLDRVASKDIAWTAANPRWGFGEVTTIHGTIVTYGDWAATGALILYVSIDDGGICTVVLNQHTRLSWPPAWGRVRPNPNADTPVVQLPDHIPKSLTGHWVTAHGRWMSVPGGRTRLFAMDATLN